MTDIISIYSTYKHTYINMHIMMHKEKIIQFGKLLTEFLLRKSFLTCTTERPGLWPVTVTTVITPVTRFQGNGDLQSLEWGYKM